MSRPEIEPTGQQQHRPPRHQGTRWWRALVPGAAGVGLLAAMSIATMQQALGFDATLKIMNSSTDTNLNGMSFSTSLLKAQDAGFGMAPVKLANGTWKNVLRAGFSGATMQGLCVSKAESLPVLGAYTVRLFAPSGTAITANNGVFDLTDMVGDSSGPGITLAGSTQIGLSTADITTVSSSGGTGAPYDSMPLGDTPSGSNSPLDTFDASLYTAASKLAVSPDGRYHTFGGGWTGIDAGSANITKLAGRLWQVQLSGNITLPKLQIAVTPGISDQCASWPTDPNYSNAKTFP